MATLIPRLQPHDRPAACGYFPQVMKDDEGFVVGETYERGLGDIRQVISVTSLRELARRYAGMHTAEAMQQANDTIASLTEQVERLETELMDAERELEGVDALTKRGYVVRKAPGRKPSKKTQEEN